MTLARRLLLGALGVISTLVVALVLIAGSRLRDRLVADALAEMTRDAAVVAGEWRPGVNADALAARIGAAIGLRVTLIDIGGTVAGDSDYSAEARPRLENHAGFPEVGAARASGVGVGRRRSTSTGQEELYVATRHPMGAVRVGMSTRRLDAIVGGAQRDVLVSGVLALLGAMLLAMLFARTISRPVIELRDVARAIAAGDLRERPALSAPGEVGDLADALHRMAEQLESRLDALEADDLLMVAVLESLEEGVLAVDERGMIVRLNQRARLLLDVSAPTPFPRELLPRDATLRTALEHGLEGSATTASETTLHERTVSIAAHPLPTAGAVVTVLDLTMVRRLEMIRRDFVANVSHELKTPLTAVSGYAETLLDETIPAAQRQAFVQTIRDNAGRMQRIVDDLLDLSRIESGGWRPRLGTIDIRTVVADCLAVLAPAATEKGLRLVAEIADDAAHVRADPTAFRQVITNLLENAVRYTHDGGITVVTRHMGHVVSIEVRDTGIGIPAEHLPRIFERFYRADLARSRDQGGTGLGLAIVRHLVDAHGGRVEATSTVGRGTSIQLFLPIHPEG